MKDKSSDERINKAFVKFKQTEVNEKDQKTGNSLDKQP